MPFKMRFAKLLRDAQGMSYILSQRVSRCSLSSPRQNIFSQHLSTLSHAPSPPSVALAIKRVRDDLFSTLSHDPTSRFSVSLSDWFGSYCLWLKCALWFLIKAIYCNLFIKHTEECSDMSHVAPHPAKLYHNLIAKWGTHGAWVSISLCSAKHCD